MRNLFRLITATVLAMLATTSLAQDPNLKRGFEPGKRYDLLGLDSVSTYNGNLNVRIPLGQPYRVGPSLQYQFMLAYNSKVWEFEWVEGRNDPGDPMLYKRRAIPERRSEAGLGWSLTLGELLPWRAATDGTPEQGITYVSPDGSEHEFYGSTDKTLLTYTQDSSYLRLRRLPANENLPATDWYVDFPDGVTHHFDADGNLLDIVDPFGNWVTVDRTNPLQWTIKDGYGPVGVTAARTHTIVFDQYVNPDGTGYYDNLANFKSLPSSISLAAFDGTSAVHQFQYHDVNIVRGSCGDPIAADAGKPSYHVPLLKQVTLPDGTAYVASYEVSATSEPYPCTSGTIKKLVLPTLGAIAWKHGQYQLTNSVCLNMDPQYGGSGTPWWTMHAGVVERSLLDETGTVLQRRVYSPFLVRRAAQNYICGGQQWTNLELPPEEFRNTITVYDGSGPSANALEKSTHYFSAFGAEARRFYSTFADPFEQGLPLIRNVSDGGRFLSTRTYQCGNGTCTDDVVKTTYVKYAPITGYPPVNPRVDAQRTVYDADSGCGSACYTDSASSDYDGYGHYKTTVASTNIPDSPTRTTFTDYTPDSTNWLLNLYTTSWVKQTVAGASSATKSVATFSPTTGVMTALRSLKAVGSDPDSLAEANVDLLTVWCRDGTTAGQRGYVTSERYFGGDRGSFGAGDRCTAARSDGNYFLNHTYTFDAAGALASHKAQYAGTTHLVADEELDANTGWVTASYDTAGVPTHYDFDTSGRLTSIRPYRQVETFYDYPPVSNPPKVAVTQVCPTGEPLEYCSNATLGGINYYYDDLGRLSQEVRQYEAGAWASTWTTYDALGRKKTVSVPVGGTSGDASNQPIGTKVTSWTYDTLGRPTIETRPDDKSTSFVYRGVRETERHSGGIKRSTETFNGAGQLVTVTQTPDATEGSVVTTYGYDAGGRLASVKMKNGSGTVQQRLFDYDGRGFLRWENHPEAGMTSYLYDARGHVREKSQSAASSEFDLKFDYDAAERLLKLWGRNPRFGLPGEPIFRILKEFEFGSENGTIVPIDLSKGKLVSAARYNYRPLMAGVSGDDTYKIADVYQYLDGPGRLTNRTTFIYSDRHGPDWFELKPVSMSVIYDALGRPQKIVYPHCLDCGAPDSAPVRSNMSYAYEFGKLKSISGFVTDIDYWPNGLRRDLYHANGRTDSQISDVMPRPSQISLGGSVDRCERPSFVSHPLNTSGPAGGTVTLTVVAAGTAPFEYLWVRDLNGVFENLDQTTQSITVPVTPEASYYVVVKNACGYEQSHTAKVTSGCTVPSTGPIELIRQPDESWLLRANPTARAGATYAWKRLSDNAAMGSGETLNVPTPTVSTTYRFTVTDTCGSHSSDVTLKPPVVITQTELTAIAISATQITVEWPAVSGATYVVQRRSGAGWEDVGQPATASFTDAPVGTGRRTYAYRVYAVKDGVQSGYSNSDVATLGTFSTTAPGQPLTAATFDEMLAAVNSVRTAAGWPVVTWTSILAPSDALPQPSVPVLGRHLLAVRSRMNEALSALGVPSRLYLAQTVQGEAIRAADLNEVLQSAQ